MIRVVSAAISGRSGATHPAIPHILLHCFRLSNWFVDPGSDTVEFPMQSQIVATGSYVPVKIVRNDDLTQFPKAALPLIEAKTGVRERRHADDSECTSDLAAQACLRCLESAGL